MIKKITLFIVMFTFLNLFSQEQKEGNRAGVIFYSTVDKTEKFYEINVDLFELGSVKFIEAELYNEDNERLSSRLFELIYREKKYFTKELDKPEKEVFLYDISFKMENIDNSLNYPKIKINMLDKAYKLIDFSQKIFY